MADGDTALTLGDPDPKGQGPEKVARWLAEVELYERESRVWQERSKKIIRRYKDERGPYEDGRRRFNILWSNVQTMMPALYSRNPKPDIQRRFKDADPLGRVCSTVLERSVSYFCDTDGFAATIRQAVLDYLLPGRGVTWERYDPTIERDEAEITDDAERGEGGDETGGEERVEFEDTRTDYVHMSDFGHDIARTWEEVGMVWRRVFMTRPEMLKRFGEERGALPPLDHGHRDERGRYTGNIADKSNIYELWDKRRKCAVWFHKTLPEALDYRPDPLGLTDFFPCPKPMFANLANDSCIPTPDYVEYQDQADELDQLTGRIHSIQKALKVAGVYDASAPALARLLSEGIENQLIPVETWAMFAEKGGIKGAVDFIPIKEVAETLAQLYEVRQQVKNDLYEITGLSDIIRGQSDPNETATAQGIKSNFATMRLSDRQGEVQRFIREIVRIKTDIICNHFQDETIKKISGVQLFTDQEKQIAQQMFAQAQQPPIPPQYKYMTQDQLETMMTEPSWDEVFKLLRDQPMRSFRIDIETDSTITQDQEAEKASRVEFLGAAGQFLEKAVTAGAQQPELTPLLAQMLMFGIRAFPVGKELEGTFNATLAKLEKAAKNPQPKPDPEMAKVKAQSDRDQAKVAADKDVKLQTLQAEQQSEAAAIANEQKLAEIKAQYQAQVDSHRADVEAQRESEKQRAEMELEQFKIERETAAEVKKAHIQAAASIEVARIGAGQDSGDVAEAREQQFEDDGTPIATEKPPTGFEMVSKALGHVADANAQQADGHRETQAQLAQMAQAHQAAMQQQAQSHSQLMQAHMDSQHQHQQTMLHLMRALTGEREVVRDPKTGKATGVRHKVSMQ